MSDTQSYKTVTFSQAELLAIAFALDARVVMLQGANYSSGLATTMIATTRQALVKVEAAL